MPRLKGKRLAERENAINQAITHYNGSSNHSMRVSAETFGIPYTTLRDRLNGAKSRQVSHRSQQLLSEYEEITIVKWCERMDDWGFPLKLGLVKEMAAYLVHKREIGRTLGKNWLNRFLLRNPQISSKFSTRLDRRRAVTDNPKLLKDYFKKLKQVIKLYDILPKDCYNMDEKGFMMGMAAKVKVICRAGRKNPRLTHSGNRTWVTVIESVSAAGIALPPMVINQGVAHYMGWYACVNSQESDKATFAYSTKGWTDSGLGMEWLVNNFDKFTAHVAGNRYRLLIMDGHVSHVTWEFFDYCLSHRIVPFCLPPHSTHLLQPLDVGLFSPLQKHYSNVLDEAMEGNRDTGINKGIFLSYLFEARRRTYTKSNILAAWSKAGIEPFNPRKVLNPIPAKKPASFAVSGPNTPRTTRMARATTNRALALVHSSGDNPKELCTLIEKLNKALQITITEKEIGDHVNSQFRKSLAKKSSNTKDRKRLTKARVITIEEVERLKKDREEADLKKAAKTQGRESKKNLKKSKKQVKISESVAVCTEDIMDELVGLVGGADENWSGSEDITEELLPTVTRTLRKWR